MNYVVTSQKFNNEICALTSQIEVLKAKRDQAQHNTKDCLTSLPPEQIDALHTTIAQNERVKRDLELAMHSKLATALEQVNGKAWANTICADRLIALAQEFEELLDAHGIKVKNRAGTLVRYRPGGKKASRAQIGRSITTFVVLRRVHDGWRLIHAQRDYCYINQRAFRDVIVRPAAHEDIIRHATRGFRAGGEHSTQSLVA